jgi:hypothetical protein
LIALFAQRNREPEHCYRSSSYFGGVERES